MSREESNRRDPGTGSPTEGTAREVEIRPPTARDAADIWRLVADTPVLDDNSPYAYMLLCTHFAQTGLVARAGGALVGFVLGYARPDDGATAFVWQVAVAEEARGRGIGGQLLDGWFARCARRSDVRFLEATVTPSNAPSRALFSSFAVRHGAPVRESVAFPASLFPGDVPHEDEVSMRVGPVLLSRVFTSPTQETL